MRDDITERLDRRTFVTLLGAAGATAIAGCADDEGVPETPEEEPDAPEEEPETPEEEPETTEEEPETTEEEQDGEQEEQESYELRVLVEDSMGEPIEGASVDVEDDEGTSALEEPVETGPEGAVVFELPDGEYTVRVQAEGFTESEEQITIAGSDEELVVQLEDEEGQQGDEQENGTEEDDQEG
jgi:hypothetical protein